MTEIKYGRIAEKDDVNTAIYRCFEHITEEDARKFVKKFSEQPHHGSQVTHTFSELILGAFLCREGLPARYDWKIENETPDWSIIDGAPKGIVELVNFHTANATEQEIHAAMDQGGSWIGRLGSNVDRLYDRIWEKACAYKGIRDNMEIPYAVAVFSLFTACVQVHEVEECIYGDEHGLFQKYPDLSGVVFFDESGGVYRFRYIPNPAALRPWTLPIGAMDLSR
jgi:hypothetical protein